MPKDTKKYAFQTGGVIAQIPVSVGDIMLMARFWRAWILKNTI